MAAKKAGKTKKKPPKRLRNIKGLRSVRPLQTIGDKHYCKGYQV